MSPRCNLIVDSCCDLPFDVVAQEGVELLKFTYITEEGSYQDDLYQSTLPHDFFEAMRNGAQPSTAQLSRPVLDECFRRCLSNGLPTVFLCFSSGLSGSYDAASLLREELMGEFPEAELYVVDTRLASVAEALLVYEALEKHRAGATAAELVAWAEEARFKVNALFMLDDLDALRRGGRIPATVAYAGAKLDVKPMLNIGADGRLGLVGVARGRKKGLKQLVEFFEQNHQGEDCLAIIGNADCPEEAARLKDLIAGRHPQVRFVECNIGPVIGSHVGPGMIAVVCWGSDKREGGSVVSRIARRVRNEE